MKIALQIVLVLIAGCSNLQKRTYDVTVKNDSSKPVTVWLTKNGPAYEPGWKAPEEIALENLRASEPTGGLVVPPGKTAFTGKLTGQFAPHVSAILRIYLGHHTDLNELLTINRDSRDRIEIELEPGVNVITVKDDGTGVVAASMRQ